MSSNKKGMNVRDVITLICTVLSLIVAFVGLTLSDNVKSLLGSSKVVATSDSFELLDLTGIDGYLGLVKVTNLGENPSKDIKIIINFKSEVSKYEIYSDEAYESESIKEGGVRISFKRLSTNSELKILSYSKDAAIFDMYYIDNTGKYDIPQYVVKSNQSVLDIFLLIVVILSLLIIVWVYRRFSESTLIETLESHQNEIQKGFREVRDEIGNIEIIVEDHPKSEISSGDTRGFGKTISEIMSKI